MKAVLRGLGLANPPLRVTQAEVLAQASRSFELSAEERSLYRKLLLEGRIEARFFGMRSLSEIGERSPDALIKRFLDYGFPCAAEAARKAMAEAGIAASELRGVVVNTCTGYLCPGLSSYLAEALGLRKDVGVLDLMGMGCGAALPNLESAAGMALLRGGGPVLSVAVEICSSTIYPSHEPELIVSNCIFGDGAAAAVLDLPGGAAEGGLAGILDFESSLRPEWREELRYRSSGGLLRNSLSKKVPVLGAKAAKGILDALLARNGLKREGVRFWCLHPGGTQVLFRVAEALGLNEEELSFSLEVFERYGNMSSPSVLFVLDGVLRSGKAEPGDKCVLISFGAGFSAFGCLLELR